jgi:hypothetical protein
MGASGARSGGGADWHHYCCYATPTVVVVCRFCRRCEPMTAHVPRLQLNTGQAVMQSGARADSSCSHIKEVNLYARWARAFGRSDGSVA